MFFCNGTIISSYIEHPICIYIYKGWYVWRGVKSYLSQSCKKTVFIIITFYSEHLLENSVIKNMLSVRLSCTI